LVTVTPLRFWP